MDHCRVNIAVQHGLPDYNVYHANGFEPPWLYRYFQEESHAKALLQGDVWISTLERCRGYETVGQGDDMEGQSSWNVRKADSPAGLAAQHMMNRNGGPILQDCEFGPNCAAAIAIESRLPDAYVVCTTQSPAQSTEEVFGQYCVEISNPLRFFWLVTNRLVTQKPIFEAVFGPIKYAPLERWDEEPPRGPLGMVKRPDAYANQREVRLLWTTRENPIGSFSLTVQGVPRLCRLVNQG